MVRQRQRVQIAGLSPLHPCTFKHSLAASAHLSNRGATGWQARAVGSSRVGGWAGRKLVAPGEAVSELAQQDRGSRARSQGRCCERACERAQGAGGSLPGRAAWGTASFPESARRPPLPPPLTPATLCCTNCAPPGPRPAPRCTWVGQLSSSSLGNRPEGLEKQGWEGTGKNQDAKKSRSP